MGPFDTDLALHAVGFSRRRAILPPGGLNLDDAGLAGQAPVYHVSQSVGLPKSPNQLKSNEAILKKRVQAVWM